MNTNSTTRQLLIIQVVEALRSVKVDPFDSSTKGIEAQANAVLDALMIEELMHANEELEVDLHEAHEMIADLNDIIGELEDMMDPK